MDEEKMKEIAEKIKNKTATEEELFAFVEEYTKILNKVNEELKS